MLKFQPKCRVCLAVKDNPKLLNEIFASGAYLPSGVSLKSLQRNYPELFSYESLKEHVKKHQFLSEGEYTKRSLQNRAKRAEQALIRQTVESADVFDEIIGQGMEALQSGDIKVEKVQDLLAAARYKKEFQLRETDNHLKLAEMMWHFTSGENDNRKANPYDRRIIEGETTEAYDPAASLAADSERRQEQSSSFYQSLAGDAPASRPD